MRRERLVIRAWLKAGIDFALLILAVPCGATCWLERRLRPGHEAIFAFWAQALAMLPGHPGSYLRRAFYRLTLESCASSFFIGFGAFFAHREARIEDGVYIGAYAIVGSASLGRGCLIGSRVSLLSGPALHELDHNGVWTHFDPTKFRRIEIGEHTWVGEAAVVMADVGAGALVSAGAVVSTPVPPGVVVAGNPARFVRSVSPEWADGAAGRDAPAKRWMLQR
jgi:acetyltransferase-like isoleucine patch superfamily enzyme